MWCWVRADSTVVISMVAEVKGSQGQSDSCAAFSDVLKQSYYQITQVKPGLMSGK